MAWIKVHPFRIWFAFALTVVLALVAGIVRSADRPPAGQERVATGSTPSADPTDADTVTGHVTAAGLTLNHPGGASLSVPAGALPVGTVVAITKGSAATLSQLGALQPDRVSWDVAASAEPPSLPVTLVLPYDAALVPAGTRPLVTTYDELSGWWVPVKTDAVPQTGKLIAELPGFSLKTWMLDRVPDRGAANAGARNAGRAGSRPAYVSWLEYQGLAMLNRRATRPQCTGRKPPSWVKHVVVSADPGISACVRGGGTGFAIEAANNHGYPVTLDLDAPFTRATASALDSTVDGLLARLPGGVLLVPTGTSVIAYDPPPAPVGTVQGRLSRDGDTMVRWLLLAALDATPAARTGFGPAAVECGRRALAAGAQVNTGVVVLLDCLAGALTAQLRAAGFDVTADLWRSDRVGQLPGAVYQEVGALRWVRGLQAGDFARLAAEVTDAGVPAAGSGSNAGTPAAGNPAAGGSGDGRDATAAVAVLARWAEAPRWTRPASVRPLYELAATVVPPVPSGQRLSARLAGRAYPDSTGAWVACADPPVTLTYQLAGKFRRFTAVVGVADTAPPDFAARFEVALDGRTVAAPVVDQKETAAVDVAVPGGRTMVISAVRTAGGCPPSPLPLGVLGGASLFR
jgi:hypothetical protein